MFPEDTVQDNEEGQKELEEEGGRETEEEITLLVFRNSCGAWPVGKSLA
jgi:hypothetical protein